MKNNAVLETCARKLESYFNKYHGAIVAYNGGVDSALPAYVAHRVLENRMVTVIADNLGQGFNMDQRRLIS